MAARNFPDEWLVPTITALVSAEAVEELRKEAQPTSTLWELTTSKGKATDEQILEALSKRTRLKIADLSLRDAKVKELISQGVAQRYRVVPLRATDSWLDVATSNPYDIDAEKALAFSTGREIRVLLASPTRIGAAID